MKERLEAAKMGSTRGLASPTQGGGFSFGGAGSRIAKPLRGGGGAVDPNANGTTQVTIPTLSGLQQEAGKRSSWFFNQRS